MSTQGSSAPRWLTAREQRAWRGYMRMRELLYLQITRDLAQDSGLSDADYQVLVGLSEAPGRRVRLIELADLMHWSKSRLAHQLDRMQERGLVRRESDPAHSRAVVVVLTETGLATMERAAPLHVESVRRHFVDPLTEEQLDAVADAAEIVLERLRRAGAPAGPDPGTGHARRPS